MRSLLFVMLVMGCGKVSNDNPPEIDAPPEPECPPGATAVCEGSTLSTCDASGNVTATETCALGCNGTEERCNRMSASNSLTEALDEAAQAPDLIFDGDATIDTDAGTIIDQSGARNPPTKTLSAGLPVGVFVIEGKAITMHAVTVVGTKALAIVAGGKITIDGLVSVSARVDVSGPGGIDSCRAGSAADGTDGDPGGGGGGFGTKGGNGGTGGVPALAGGTGGQPTGNVELVPLRGGCPGGHPGGRSLDANPVASDPGGAGGALQLVSATEIEVAQGGVVAANGAGGHGSSQVLFCVVDAPCGDGEGGGSGGGILLEAPKVTVAVGGAVVANGGGGSCAVTGNATSGGNTDAVAEGQTCGGDTGAGGNGAAGAVAAQNGANGLNDDPVGGGGGGGGGRIRVNLPAGAQFSPAGIVSPASSSGVIVTR